MKYMPLILVLLSFAVICVGAYLKSLHYYAANAIILGGIISEIIFIVLNRLLHRQRKP